MAQKELKFLIQGTNVEGKKVKETIIASSEARAYQNAKGRGIVPSKVTMQSGEGLQMDIKIPGIEKRVKTKHLAVFAKQFSVLIKSGMSLVRALQVVGEQTEDKTLKVAINKCLSDVESGGSLSRAMEKQPQAFPPLMVSLVRVGEGGGFLDQTLDTIAKTYKSELELKARVKSAVTYPIIVGAIAILAVIAMLIFVVPIFKDMFDGMNAELPLPTQILVDISNNMIWITPIFVVTLIIITAVYTKNKDKLWVRSKLDPFKLKMPVFGKLNSKVSIARFSRNLAMMLSAGVPLMTALNLVGSSSNNWVMESALETAAKTMENGKGFASTISKFTIFPPIVSQMILVGEESGSLPQMLNSIADFYEDEVKETTDSLASAMEPIMILGLGGLVGGMIVALYMPMFSMFSHMTG